jgi:hypothetical protein
MVCFLFVFSFCSHIPTEAQHLIEEACSAVLSGSPSLLEQGELSFSLVFECNMSNHFVSGQSILLSFQQSPSPFDVCVHIFNNSQIPFAQFQVCYLVFIL